MEKENGSAWVLRLDDRLQTCLSEDVIAIGWAHAIDLPSLNSWLLFKQHVIDRYPYLREASSKSTGQRLGSLWRFVKEMQIGDKVVVPSTNGFYVANVVGPVEHRQEWVDADMAWCRKAEWITSQPIPRNRAHGDLRRRMKAQQTCVECSNLKSSIEHALARESPVAITDELLSGTAKAVKNALWKSIDDRGLEELVRQLATASGAEAYIPPKKQAGDGDVDVVANYGTHIPHADARVTIGFQVKQHQGVTDVGAVQQLQGPLAREDIHQGCVVTTAEKFSPEAIQLANEERILLINGEMLAEWIISIGTDRLKSDDV